MGLSPGYLVSKHVRLVREHKRGGMGSVWIADHLGVQTQVAVKFMADAIVDDAAAVARFAREATSAAQIKSPHVVQVHDHGVTPDGVPFMVMELLHGEDLSARIKRQGLVPLEDAAQIVFQVCRVLGRAHQLGIVHRDIKPSNIFLLDTDGEIFVKVLDFGVAKLGDDGGSELTTTGAMVGTLVYMSPEQLLAAKSVDHRADLWSLAVVIYRALTGELPFKNDDGLGALCRAVERGAFPAASQYVASLPPEVDAWFERAFEPEIEARFGSAKEMAAELHRAIGEVVPLPPMSSALRAEGRGDGSTRAGAREGTLSNGGVPRRPAGAEKADRAARIAAAHDEPLTGTPAQTLAGTASTPPSLRGRVTLRRLAIGVVAIGVLGGAGLLGRSLGWLPLRRSVSRALPAAVGSAAATPTASAKPEKPEITPVGDVAPAASPSPAAAPSASTSATASASVSAAPPSAAGLDAGSRPRASGGKGRGRQGGGPRPGQPEKDYGF